jgi:replicative DNA helicase
MTPESVQPHSIEAEQALLGAVIVHSDIVFELVDRRQPLLPSDFFEPMHQALWDAFQREHAGGHKLDQRLAMLALGQVGDIRIDGQEGLTVAMYAARLAAAATTIINAPDYARIIREHSTRRKPIDTAEALILNARSDMPPADCAGLAIETIDECTARPNRKSTRVNIYEASNRSLERMQEGISRDGRISGVSTGVRDLDARVGGLQPADLIILAGRPGMGKSGVAVSIARAGGLRQYSDVLFLARNERAQPSRSCPGRNVLRPSRPYHLRIHRARYRNHVAGRAGD